MLRHRLLCRHLRRRAAHSINGVSSSRWGGADANRTGALAQELVGLQPDIILTNGTAVTAAVQRETRTIPIVFANGGDPVTSGIVARLDRPGGNVTGFALYEASLGGKWLELLSEIAPGIKRAAISVRYCATTIKPLHEPNSPLFRYSAG